ncbi:hypothetical protein [Paenibacillus odorifer]|uniref:hypothetical protein n=1 Tax=Paenibacillus odorifer TaxID=189426 RepID=UPI00117D7D8E|nr:hypothetical protein [Paenibacillus odorifer]
MRNIVNDTQFLSERATMMYYFQDEFYNPEKTEIFYSPSGKFKLEIHHYNHVVGIIRYNYTKGIITDSEHKTIDIIYRNFGTFLFSWLEINGIEYLLGGLDYQGYSIVNLSNKQTKHYVPEEAYKGHGFCWGEIIYFQQKKLIVIDGCYWACPYELVFYDFSNPMNMPYNELFRVEVDSITNWDNWKDYCMVRYLDGENNEKEFVF